MSKDPERDKRIIREANAQAKFEAFCIYGGTPPKCACCGETNIGFLTLDHEIAIGSLRRNKGGASFCRWLRARGWPKNLGLRVLCWNCNCGRQSNGGICPHHGLVGPDVSQKDIPTNDAGLAEAMEQLHSLGSMQAAGSKRYWEDAQVSEETCLFCGTRFGTTSQTGAKYCSDRCKFKQLRLTAKEVRSCNECSKPFRTYKYKKAKFCSYSCAAKTRERLFRARRQRGV